MYIPAYVVLPLVVASSCLVPLAGLLVSVMSVYISIVYPTSAVCVHDKDTDFNVSESTPSFLDT